MPLRISDETPNFTATQPEGPSPSVSGWGTVGPSSVAYACIEQTGHHPCSVDLGQKEQRLTVQEPKPAPGHTGQRGS